jgi:thiamine monophosphate synthase
MANIDDSLSVASEISAKGINIGTELIKLRKREKNIPHETHISLSKIKLKLEKIEKEIGGIK